MVNQETVSRVLLDSRRLWEGSDEAPAVRQVVYDLSKAFAKENPSFDEATFVQACGFEWPRGQWAGDR